jgi:hypothetical protein
MPPSVFIDSSVFFAAAYSVTGSAHDLLSASIHGRVSLVLADYVLAETERNILASAPQAHSAFLLSALAFPALRYKRELIAGASPFHRHSDQREESPREALDSEAGALDGNEWLIGAAFFQTQRR